MPQGELPVYDAPDQDDVDRSHDGEDGNLPRGKVVEGRRVAKVHGSELYGSDCSQHERVACRDFADEGEEDEECARHAYHGDEVGRYAGEVVADQAEGDGPDERSDEECRHVWPAEDSTDAGAREVRFAGRVSGYGFDAQNGFDFAEVVPQGAVFRIPVRRPVFGLQESFQKRDVMAG